MCAIVTVQNRIAELKADRNGDLQIDATSRIQHKENGFAH